MQPFVRIQKIEQLVRKALNIACKDKLHTTNRNILYIQNLLNQQQELIKILHRKQAKLIHYWNNYT